MGIPNIKTNKVSSLKRKELQEELDVVNQTINNYKARIGGGKNSAGQNMSSLDEELAAVNQNIMIFKIMHDEFVPVSPTFQYETNPLWLANQKLKLTEKLTALHSMAEALNKQKEKIATELPGLEERKADLEKKLAR